MDALFMLLERNAAYLLLVIGPAERAVGVTFGAPVFL
jgi:hypothetical protein